MVVANSEAVRLLKDEVPIPAGFTRASATVPSGVPAAVIGLRFKRQPDSAMGSRLSWLNGLRENSQANW